MRINLTLDASKSLMTGTFKQLPKSNGNETALFKPIEMVKIKVMKSILFLFDCFG
jgi:hypothetical protein